MLERRETFGGGDPAAMCCIALVSAGAGQSDAWLVPCLWHGDDGISETLRGW